MFLGKCVCVCLCVRRCVGVSYICPRYRIHMFSFFCLIYAVLSLLCLINAYQCLIYAWQTFYICSTYAWHMLEICVTDLSHTFDILICIFFHMYDISLVSTLHMFNIGTSSTAQSGGGNFKYRTLYER